jgi:hypothetical protein
MVKMMEKIELPDANMPAAINCADPAYSRRHIRAISGMDMPAAYSTTPEANPILRYPNKVGTQSLTPRIKESSPSGAFRVSTCGPFRLITYTPCHSNETKHGDYYIT